MIISNRYKSQGSTNICYYKNLDSVRINKYKILDESGTVSKSCFLWQFDCIMKIVYGYYYLFSYLGF